MISVVSLIIATAIQLLALVFFAGRIYNKIENFERRMTTAEMDIDRWRAEASTLGSLSSKLDLMQGEIVRVRNRLDTFLDGRTVQTALGHTIIERP